MVSRVVAFLVLVLATAVKIDAINEDEPNTVLEALDEKEFEMIPPSPRFFGWLPLGNVAVPCKTRANCCMGQCNAATTACVAGAPLATVCTGGVAATACRTVQTCGACDSFPCPGTTPCNSNTGRVCPVP